MKLHRLTFACLAPVVMACAVPAMAATSITACGDISQPGPYELAADLAVDGNDCLTVSANHVTIDLNGHVLKGTNVGAAIRHVHPARGITVRNGLISGFQIGVVLGNDAVVEKMSIANTSSAIVVSDGIVRGNTITNASFSGIQSNGRTIVTGNFVRNADQGILENSNVPDLVADNVVMGGRVGIGPTSFGALLAGNTVRGTSMPLSMNCPAMVAQTATSGGGAMKVFTNPQSCVFDSNVQSPQ